MHALPVVQEIVPGLALGEFSTLIAAAIVLAVILGILVLLLKRNK